MCVQLKARGLILLHNRLFSMPHYPSLPPSPLPVLSQAHYNKTSQHATGRRCRRDCLLSVADRYRLGIFSTRLCPVVQSHRSVPNNTPRRDGGERGDGQEARQVALQNVPERQGAKAISPLRFDRRIAHFIYVRDSRGTGGERLRRETSRKTRRRRCQHISV